MDMETDDAMTEAAADSGSAMGQEGGGIQNAANDTGSIASPATPAAGAGVDPDPVIMPAAAPVAVSLPEPVVLPAVAAERYAPTPAKRLRDAMKTRLARVAAYLEGARNGDPRASAAGLGLLVELLHDLLGTDTPGDCLRDALLAVTTDRTDDARASIAAARALLSKTPLFRDEAHNQALTKQLDDAGLCLAVDRAQCVAYLEQTLEAIEDGGDAAPVRRPWLFMARSPGA